MIKNIFAIIVMTVVMLSCGGDKNKSTNSTPDAQDAQRIPNSLPPLNQEVFNKMLNECTFIDYIWHELPFSVSQSEKQAVMTNVSFISSEGHDSTPAHCKSIGRKSYQINGDIFLDADIYFGGKGCNYYIFLKDEKPIYLNRMTDQGVGFYKRLFISAGEQRDKIFGADGTAQ